MSVFSDNLRKARERAGFHSARQFAAILGMNYGTYLNYETKDREPKYEILCKIAAALHVTIDELLGYRLDEIGRYTQLASEAQAIIKPWRIKGFLAFYPHGKQSQRIYVCSPAGFIERCREALETTDRANSQSRAMLFTMYLERLFEHGDIDKEIADQPTDEQDTYTISLHDGAPYKDAADDIQPPGDVTDTTADTPTPATATTKKANKKAAKRRKADG